MRGAAWWESEGVAWWESGGESGGEPQYTAPSGKKGLPDSHHHDTSLHTSCHPAACDDRISVLLGPTTLFGLRWLLFCTLFGHAEQGRC